MSVPNNMSICNERVLEETVIQTGEDKKMIEDIIGHQSRFIATKIREGGLESVRIMNFGIFKARIRAVQFKAMLHSLPKTTFRKNK